MTMRQSLTISYRLHKAVNIQCVILNAYVGNAIKIRVRQPEDR